MKRSSQAEDLISQMYEAAQEPAKLAPAILALSTRFQAHTAGLRVYDNGHAIYRYFETVGMTPGEWDAFDAACHEINPWRGPGYADLLANGLGHSDTILPVQELLKTRFYNDYARHLDIVHGMGLCLWSGPDGQMAAISMNRSRRAGAFTSDELAFARHLLSHFRSAYAIMRRLSWAETLSSSLASSVDALRAGLLLVDRDARCLYRNAAADVALAAHHGCSISRDEAVCLTNAQAHQQLLDAIRLAEAGMLAAPQRIYVRDGSERPAWVFVVSMLRGELVSLCAPHLPCAVVFVHAVADRRNDAQTSLREAFDLTPAEARLAATLTEGLSVADCAERLHVSMATVRSQLRCLFVKTRTQRQAQLISALDAVLRFT